MLRQYKINVVNLKDRLVLSGHERVNQRGRERGIERKREERQTDRETDRDTEADPKLNEVPSHNLHK